MSVIAESKVQIVLDYVSRIAFCAMIYILGIFCGKYEEHKRYETEMADHLSISMPMDAEQAANTLKLLSELVEQVKAKQ